MKTVNIKSGSTLTLSGRVALPAGVWSIASKVKCINSAEIQTLTSSIEEIVEQTDAATHTFSLSATDVETALWPVTNLLCDIRFEDSDTGKVLHSPTFTLAVERAITDVTAPGPL